MNVDVRLNDSIHQEKVINFHRENSGLSTDKLNKLMVALQNSHSLVIARIVGRLPDVANAISDRHLVVYYPHMLVHLDFHRQGLGRRMMTIQSVYVGFHQQALTTRWWRN